ncbi:spore germination protein [Paenibacillus sp. YN15]|uniref:spore germination protein n=1 Tax=Paenibacillus sp. YN15 TaxID=1742774 RepID=UPI000DCE6108|nr:spore germination protein [Paenibacillus sp. YN15]RAV06484.1 spore germination protein [Paenibacillus sp. YN15]
MNILKGKSARKTKQEKTGKAAPPPKKQPLSESLDENLSLIHAELVENVDVTFRHLTNEVRFAVILVEGIVDGGKVDRDLLQTLVKPGLGIRDSLAGLSGQEVLEATADAVPLGMVKKVDTVDGVFSALFGGSTIVLIEGCNQALAINTSGGEQRGVEETTTQTVIRGPKEGFNENLRTNLSLIRRRVKSTKLASIILELGSITRTEVAVVYLDGIARKEMVDEVMQRLASIKTDSILDSGYIEEFIQDSSYSPFPTLLNTERPDVAVGALLEGKVAIIVDGTPFVLIAPAPFTRYFQSSEDYYQRADISSFLRIIRFVAFFLSMLLPALYISITTFHQEMLPTPLLISLAAQREGVPFPAFIEAILMELTFEVLREAGVRMPRAIGPAISIVGALVLGQAAVQAGLVSAAMVIVVSFTAISNFVVPYISMSISARLIRFGMMILGGSFGLFGIMSGMMFLLIHLEGLRTFGVPYMGPFSPLRLSELKDVLIRAPRWAMNKRPDTANPGNQKRQPEGQQPLPPKKPEGDRQEGEGT